MAGHSPSQTPLQVSNGHIHDIALTNPDSRAGDTKKQGKKIFSCLRAMVANIQCPEAAKAEVAELVGSVWDLTVQLV